MNFVLFCKGYMPKTMRIHFGQVQTVASHGDSGPSEASKRGSGGGSPGKYDDLLTASSDLDVQSRRDVP